jgi:hypothetical protein
VTLAEAVDIAQIITGVGSLLVAGLAIRASRQISSQQQVVALGASRAYVTPESGQVTTFTVGKAVEVALVAKNWGQTPALKTRVTSRVYFASSANNAIGRIPLFIEPNKAAITLPPQQLLQLGPNSYDSTPLTTEQLRDISAGVVTLYSDFLIEYYDVAGVKHETSIRYFLDPVHLANKPFASLSFGKDGLSMC